MTEPQPVIAPLEFAPARLSLAAGAWTSFVLAALSGALVVLAFGWPLGATLIGTLIGIAIFSVLEFVTATRHEIPQATDLPRAPADALIERRRWPRPIVLLALPVVVGIAWLAEQTAIGAAIIPGQFGGYALANLAGATLVSRWQRTHGGEVLVRRNLDEPELYVSRG
jgi:hypothetical protein